MMQGKLLFLGTGASMGTPVITCSCAICRSNNPKDHRMRPSALVKIDGKQILIDAGPDFRQQALKIGLQTLDGIILTHTHYDHIAGLDDLRVFYFIHHKVLPCMVSQETFEEIKIHYHYFFHKVGGSRFQFQVLKNDFGKAEFAGLEWKYCTFVQNGMKVTGYRLGNLAYILDIKEFSDEVYAALEGVDVLVMSALRSRPSPAHLTIEEAVMFAKKVGAKKTYFSHIAHEVDHDKVSQELPPGIELAYDGLEIPFYVH
jgi:phosphoribosyl 1,2-cyclic phosphate phosphodiesterase